MLIRLDVASADVRAADLQLLLEAAPEPGLEALAAEAGGFAVELRLLGCSHQALVDGGETLSETVACRPGRSGSLPERSRRHAGDAEYAFGARVHRLRRRAYVRRARHLIAAVAGRPDGLVGLFPGPAGAFTALRLRPTGRGVVWSTWHGYPQTGELVVTRSTLERR